MKRPLRKHLTPFAASSLSRRELLRAGGITLTGAGAALLFGCGDGNDDDSPIPDAPPEVTKLRLSRPLPVCVVAQYVAEEFLRAEGFEEVEYIPIQTNADVGLAVSERRVDFAMNFAAPIAVHIDRGDEMTVLTGMHVGCFEFFGTGGITTANELKGKTIAVSQVGADSADYMFIAGILQNVGIDVQKDVKFEELPRDEAIARLQAGTIDAYLAFPPVTQDLRARGIGRVILSSIEDPPWRQYFCCMVTANPAFIKAYPAATKRVVRAYVRAAEHCAQAPEEVADFLVKRGYMDNRDYAGAMMRSLPYDVWRRYDPEDTLRFYALRLREAGVISSTPDEIIERGADWRFLEQLKEEMAAAPFRPAGASPFYCDLFAAKFLGPMDRLGPLPGGYGS